MKDFARTHIRWLGHDTFRITGPKTIYFDPFKVSDGEARADIICVTHEHFDHFSPDDIRKIQSDRTVVVAPPDVAKKWSGNGKALKAGDKVTVEGIEIEAVPSYNVDKKFHPQANRWLGYIITVEGVKIYHAGDTDHIPEMKKIKTDIALLPVSGTYVMTAEEAAEAALEIHPRLAIPMHYGDIVGTAKDAERFCKILEGRIPTMILQKS